ncbi:hypothetical protein [Kordiimonas pumila]|uniref:Uncharacterized protein n=1 Tax=Kordiimonas pumila TaxID=2161677 RepID=A0ABV7D393_9PROT|nr:hypothetical protein [Kordiimonas pumila]
MQHTGTALLYGAGIFALMLAVLLYPHTPDKLMVVVRGYPVPADIYAVLADTDAQLIEKISDRRYIVQYSAAGDIRALYKNGAFLVLNALPKAGCNSAAPKPPASPFVRIQS